MASVDDIKTKYFGTETGEDTDFIHMRKGFTGGNNQGLGMTSDHGHRRKGK